MRRYAIHHVMKYWCALGAQSTAAPNPNPHRKRRKVKSRQSKAGFCNFSLFSMWRTNSRGVDKFFWVVETTICRLIMMRTNGAQREQGENPNQHSRKLVESFFPRYQPKENQTRKKRTYRERDRCSLSTAEQKKRRKMKMR